MDSSIQIKNNLISRIKNSNDINFLRALQTIFDSLEQSLYELSEQQKKSIEIGREEIQKGNFKEHEQVMTEMREWLKKK
jgi:predicted transcriptional regulator